MQRKVKGIGFVRSAEEKAQDGSNQCLVIPTEGSGRKDGDALFKRMASGRIRGSGHNLL